MTKKILLSALCSIFLVSNATSLYCQEAQNSTLIKNENKKSYAEYVVKGVYICVAVCAVAFLTYKAYQTYTTSNTAAMPDVISNTPDINLPEAPTLTALEIQAPTIPDVTSSIALPPVVSQEVISDRSEEAGPFTKLFEKYLFWTLP